MEERERETYPVLPEWLEEIRYPFKSEKDKRMNKKEDGRKIGNHITIGEVKETL